MSTIIVLDRTSGLAVGLKHSRTAGDLTPREGDIIAVLPMAITRREFVAGAAAAPYVMAQRTRRPNVLLIVADEWRAQATGYNGDPNVRAPVLDRLASQSVSFDTAISCTPVCCPFRGCLVTGQFPLTHGV